VKTAWIDRWIERANQKEAAMAGRLDEERKRRREEHQREQQELTAINQRWEKL
jgi:Skp family chaperone for outer membrane proteins